jgi:3-hydroxyisobutyrate dehydrogenase-like beta-hydroxyacid dehydrogenase
VSEILPGAVIGFIGLGKTGDPMSHHLLVTSEAMAAAAFGLDVPVVLDAINTSSGRSGSTENKWPTRTLPLPEPVPPE